MCSQISHIRYSSLLKIRQIWFCMKKISNILRSVRAKILRCFGRRRCMRYISMHCFCVSLEYFLTSSRQPEFKLNVSQHFEVWNRHMRTRRPIDTLINYMLWIDVVFILSGVFLFIIYLKQYTSSSIIILDWK